MEYIEICGGTPLKGEIEVSGGKNAALGIIAASVLSPTPVRLENVPYVADVKVACEILQCLRVGVEMPGNGIMRIDPTTMENNEIPEALSAKMRASYYFCSVLLARFGHGVVAMPGGCAIGERPIDQTVKGLSALGAEVTADFGKLEARGEKLVGAEIYMDCVSVGATINTLLAAVLARGQTIIHNAAKEPHIVDVASFLNSMGAKIKGAGTADIRVTGVSALHGSTYTVVPDQIETGTMLIAAAATQGDVTVRGVIPIHMEALTAKLLEAGCQVHEYSNAMRVQLSGRPRSVNVITLPYPGFPTDLQQPMAAMLTVAKGTSIINETIYESRFKYLTELKRMGARANVLDKIALIEGIPQLRPGRVMVPDLRAGAALVIAALMAQGTTLVGNAHYISRGYEHLEEKLEALGAKIQRVEA